MPKVIPMNKPRNLSKRTYNLSKETKGTWLYMWADAPQDTPEWACKWYLLKSEYPVCPGAALTVTIE